LNFSIDSPQFNLNWSHGDIPSLKLSFHLSEENITICKFNFEVNAFWEHLEEVLSEEN